MTRAEARRVACGPVLRDELEQLLLGLRRTYPGVESLVVYVVEDEQVVGFLELLVAADGFRWHGPHVTPDAGTPSSGYAPS